MSRSKFLVAHTADLHLESGYSHGSDGPDGLNSRFHDFAQTWEFICRDSIAREVDLFIFAGDMAKTRNPSPTAYRAFKAGLDVLATAGIPVLLVTGNHDLPAAPGKASAMEILAGGVVHVSSRPELIPGDRWQLATLPSVSRSTVLAKDEYKDLTREQTNDLMARKLIEIARGLRAQMTDDGIPRILVAHHSVSGASTSTDMMTTFFDEPVLPLHELTAMGFDAIMLGHIHRPQEIGMKVYYPGSPERIDFGEEEDLKQYGIWTFWPEETPEGKVVLDKIPVPARRFVTLPLEHGGISGRDLTDAVVRVKGKISEEDARSFDRAALARLIYEQGASKVVPIELEIERTVTVRDSEMTEAMGPIEALTRYMTNQGVDTDRQGALKDACEELLQGVAP